jgi:hypothetical protein
MDGTRQGQADRHVGVRRSNFDVPLCLVREHDVLSVLFAAPEGPGPDFRTLRLRLCAAARGLVMCSSGGGLRSIKERTSSPLVTPLSWLINRSSIQLLFQDRYIIHSSSLPSYKPPSCVSLLLLSSACSLVNIHREERSHRCRTTYTDNLFKPSDTLPRPSTLVSRVRGPP